MHATACLAAKNKCLAAKNKPRTSTKPIITASLPPLRVAAMPTLLTKTLRVVPAPLVETVPTAPPALETPNPTVECKCGNCGAVLMRVDGNKARPLMVHCISCGSYNSTDDA